MWDGMLWAVVAASLTSAPVSGASQRDHADCNQAGDRERSIAGCTRILEARGEAARSRAIAGYNRGNAYYAKGDYDRAIADYTEAVWLDPTSALVFNNRGKAYLGKGDYGPSGEDVTHRFVLAGMVRVPGGFELSTVTQAESARPFTITLADNSDRILVNGVRTTLDQFRGTPYIQADLRVSRPINFHDRWSLIPFAEFFNLFNRNNPGANYVANVAVLPVPANEIASGNVMHICTNLSCTTQQPVTSLNQLRVAGGGLGDFFGPGTTVGIPFAAQLGVRVTF